jgi:hypothetical protein
LDPLKISQFYHTRQALAKLEKILIISPYLNPEAFFFFVLFLEVTATPPPPVMPCPEILNSAHSSGAKSLAVPDDPPFSVSLECCAAAWERGASCPL